MAFNKYAGEYAKERKLLLQQVRRMKRRGYVFNDLTIPDKPKRITDASVRRLRNMRENIYKKAELPDIETGELKKVGSRKAGLKQEKEICEEVKRESAPQNFTYNVPETAAPETTADGSYQWSRDEWDNERKGETENMPDFADMVINNFRGSISEYNAPFVNYINNWLDILIDNPEVGKDAVADMLQEGAQRGFMINYKVAYDFQLRDAYISDMMSILEKNTDPGQFTMDQLWEQLDQAEGVFYEGMTAAEAAGL